MATAFCNAETEESHYFEACINPSFAKHASGAFSGRLGDLTASDDSDLYSGRQREIPCPVYSLRNACMGWTAAARRAGKKDARDEQAKSRMSALIITETSSGFTL